MTDTEKDIDQLNQRFATQQSQLIEGALEKFYKELGYELKPVVFPVSFGCQRCGKKKEKLSSYTGFNGLASFVERILVCAPCLAVLDKENYQHYQATEEYWMKAFERIREITLDTCHQYTMALNKILLPQQVDLYKLTFYKILDDLVMSNKIVVMGNLPPMKSREKN